MWVCSLWLLLALGQVSPQAQSSCSRYPEFRDIRTNRCKRDQLGSPCVDTAANSCEFGVVNGRCDASGVCSCAEGYQETLSIYGERQCTKVIEGSRCNPGAAGDSLCRLALQDPDATCESVSCTCQCPTGKAYVHGKCEVRLYASQTSVCDICERTGGICFDKNGDIVPDGCYCPGKSFSSGVAPEDELSYGCNGMDADVGESCTRGLINVKPSQPRPDIATGAPGVICRDPNAECVHCGVLSGRHVCQCRAGYVPVRGSPMGYRDSPMATVCHKLLTVDDDINCRFCTAKGGLCYDINEDGVLDGCICPEGKSTTTDQLPDDYCNFDNVEVECNNSTMRVCLVGNMGDINIPPRVNDIIRELEDGSAIAFLRGNSNNTRCRLEKQVEGVYCIDLRTDSTKAGSFIGKCGALVVKPNKKQTSYMAWVIVQRKIAKHTHNDFALHAYCTYDDIKCVSNGTVVQGLKGGLASTGKKLSPTIRMYLEDKFNELVDFVPVNIGDLIRLVVEYVDDLGGTYSHLRPEICIMSSLPHLDIPSVKTALFIDHGILVDNGYISVGSNFKPDPLNSRISRTGFFRMCKFEDSDYVFFHCAVRVCRSADACRPLGRRKRRSVTNEGPLTLPETLDELEASGDYETVTIKTKAPSKEEMIIIEAKERMAGPYLAQADVAVQVTEDLAHVEKTQKERAMIRDEEVEQLMKDAMTDAKMSRKLTPPVVTKKAQTHKAKINFTTMVAVSVVGTIALTMALALSSFYILSVKHPVKKEKDLASE